MIDPRDILFCPPRLRRKLRVRSRKFRTDHLKLQYEPWEYEEASDIFRQSYQAFDSLDRENRLQAKERGLSDGQRRMMDMIRKVRR